MSRNSDKIDDVKPSRVARNLSPAELSHCLELCRSARSQILKDAESFPQAASLLEKIAQILCGAIKTGLGKYENVLLEWMSHSPEGDSGSHYRLFDTVRITRNQAVHGGAFARHQSSHLIDVFLLLEQGIMSKLKRVENCMVRGAVVAESWNLLGHVRREMLANSFSYLPYEHADGWKLIADFELLRFLSKAEDESDRRRLLASKVNQAVTDGDLRLIAAHTCGPEVEVKDLMSQFGEQETERPVLVVEDHEGRSRLLGIVTPFDLL